MRKTLKALKNSFISKSYIALLKNLSSMQHFIPQKVTVSNDGIKAYSRVLERHRL